MSTTTAPQPSESPTVARRGTETDLVKACLRLCAWSNVVADAWRNNTGVIPIVGAGKRRCIHQGRKGISDILGFTATGRFLAIECKMPGNGTTSHQQSFIDDVNRAGGLAIVVWSAAELQAAFTHLAADPQWKPRKGA